MRKSVIGLVSLVAPAILGAVATTGCDKVGDAADSAGKGFETLCGPCGAVATGDVGISGNAKVDGFFSAVASLNSAFVSINGNFEAQINDLMGTFCTTAMDGTVTCGSVEVAANATLETKIEALKGEIDAQITANVQGGLTVNYVPPRCEANVSLSVEAQAQCEAKAGCEAEVTPGEVAVSCEGTCEGSCSAGCSGGFECDLSAGGTCDGECSGSCEMTVAAECNGTCRGTCNGTCAAQNAMGECQGKCEGTCEGTCELAASATCEGSCTGSCKVMAEAMCTGEAPKCSGSCMGECTGSCKGKATPPEVAVDCEASAECKGQASAQASANLTCTPPSLDIGFNFAANVDAQAQASFSAKMAALKVSGVAIVQGFGRLTALIDGEIDGEVVIAPPPLVQVEVALEDLIQAGAEGEIFADIPVGRVNCAIGAFADAGGMLASIGTKASVSIAAQASFVGSLTTGDFGS
jgi:modification target Cys-rich repeat protein